MKPHAGLLGWVLLVQTAALPADNPQRTQPAYSQWHRATTFATQALCQEAATLRTADMHTVYNAKEGVIIRFFYTCAQEGS